MCNIWLTREMRDVNSCGVNRGASALLMGEGEHKVSKKSERWSSNWVGMVCSAKSQMTGLNLFS